MSGSGAARVGVAGLVRVGGVRIDIDAGGSLLETEDTIVPGRDHRRGGLVRIGRLEPSLTDPMMWLSSHEGADRTMAIYPEWAATDTGAPGESRDAVEMAAPGAADAADTHADTDAYAAPAIVDEGAAAPSASVTPDHDAESIAIVASADTAPVPVPIGWSDPLTGTDGPHYWDRLIISENARSRRYKRPVTIVLVEIGGLTPLGALWGADVAERTLINAARTLSKSIRTSDHIARIEPIRFGILLTETTEIAAINFIERARASCERDLRIASEVVGVAFGWASPPKSGDLADAVALATKRLQAELKEL